MTTDSYIDELLKEADGRMYCDFCLLMIVMLWNL